MVATELPTTVAYEKAKYDAKIDEDRMPQCCKKGFAKMGLGHAKRAPRFVDEGFFWQTCILILCGFCVTLERQDMHSSDFGFLGSQRWFLGCFTGSGRRKR